MWTSRHHRQPQTSSSDAHEEHGLLHREHGFGPIAGDDSGIEKNTAGFLVDA
jgi:hypothetical protein